MLVQEYERGADAAITRIEQQARQRSRVADQVGVNPKHVRMVTRQPAV